MPLLPVFFIIPDFSYINVLNHPQCACARVYVYIQKLITNYNFTFTKAQNGSRTPLSPVACAYIVFYLPFYL